MDAPSRRIPPGGLPVWPSPDPASGSPGTAGAGLEVDVLESTATGWAKVRFSNGWEGWLDGRLIIPPLVPTPAGGAAEPRRGWIEDGGQPVWDRPDAASQPVATVERGLEVAILDELSTGWARVRFSNGWEGWLDGRRLHRSG